jgi:hypothetical protein
MNILTGRKTALGAWCTVLAGGVYIGGILEPMLRDIAIGVFMAGMGLLGYGIWSRLTYIFYQRHTAKTGKEGKPNLGRSKLKKRQVGG